MAKYLEVKDGGKPSANKAKRGPVENKSAGAEQHDAEVEYASEAAAEAGKKAKLTAADFKGVKASGEKGYTKADVDAVIAAKGAK